MKLGTVIGRVTLSKSVDLLKGGRFLVVSPFNRDQFAKGIDAKPSMGTDPSLVVYDNLGGGVGDVTKKARKPRNRSRFRRRLTPSIARWWTKFFTTRGRVN